MKKKKEEAKKLAEKIRELIAEYHDAERADTSNELMSLIRHLNTIYILKSEAEEYKNSSKVTIDPYKVKLEDELRDDEREDYYRIRANSFGPFAPRAYFKLPKEQRIVWLLREPLLKKGSWDEGDRGGHNQAEEYHNWEGIKEEPGTKQNLIKYTKVLLKKLGFLENDNDDDETMNQVMKHICILEINHFPGLAFNGTNSDLNLIKNWYEINLPILKELIKFYDADIIVMGGVHECLHSCKSDVPVIKGAIKNQTGELFCGLDYTPHEDCANDYYISGNYIIPTKDDGPIFISANHPSYRYFKPDDAKFDGARILKWKEEHKK